jgi:putative thioredoxin
MMASEYVKDATDQTFAIDVIEASKENLVLVDFWAPWCGPCRTLGPNLERVVNGFKGAVKMVKVNVDQNPHFSGQLRVQSIPAVFAFKDGQPIDGFMGALPESQLKAFVEKHVGEPKAGGVEVMLAAANESLGLGEIGGAAQSFAQVLEVDRGNKDALLGMAKCYFQGGQIDEAARIIDALEVNTETTSLKAQIALALECSDAGDIDTLEAQEKSSPENLMIKLDLARSLVKNGDFETAIDKLFEIMKIELDWNDKAARIFLLKIFDALGNSSEITRFGRRRLSTLLFS